MENGETTREAAIRETLEEARARVEIAAPFGIFSIPHISQVYLIFRARLLDLDFGPGPESLEVRLFRATDIPWEQLAFPVVVRTLYLYFQDRSAGGFRMHNGDIRRFPGETLAQAVSRGHREP
jgi:ADP-ribose pyrophosphatase YjhB (NUDIX family)